MKLLKSKEKNPKWKSSFRNLEKLTFYYLAFISFLFQCHRILAGIDRKNCYRGKGNELMKFMRDFRPIENFTGSHNFSEIMKVCLL